MAFKSVGVVVTQAEIAAPAILAAAEIARAHGGHLSVLALGVDHVQVGYAYMGDGGALTELAMEREEEDAQLAEAAARAVLDAQAPGLGWSLASAVAEPGSLADRVGMAAGFSDLVVQCRPYGSGQGPEAFAVVEAALFDGRAPVLILPGQMPPGSLTQPRHVVLAWNQSAPALAAAKAALPFLIRAEMVDVTVIDPPANGPERSDPGGALCEFLVRHGVKASVTVLARKAPGVAGTLASHAAERGADLLVMGAYGHSRLREAVLGGTTREALEHSAIPVLMAH